MPCALPLLVCLLTQSPSAAPRAQVPASPSAAQAPLPKPPAPRPEPSDERLAELAAQLCSAIDAGDLPAVQAALSAGANPNVGVGAGDGDTGERLPLHHAVIAESAAIAAELLSWGARLEGADAGGHTALMYATLQQSGALLVLLLDRGARTDQADKQGNVAADYTKDAPELRAALLNTEEQRQNALAALEADDPARLAEALQAGASPSANDGEQCALLYALRRGDAELTRQLVEAGARADLWLGSGFAPRTPLGIAADECALELLEPLIAQGPGRAALAHALADAAGSAQADRTERVRRLLAAGADPNAAVGMRTPALAGATERGDLACMELLVRAGADLGQVQQAMVSTGLAPRELAVRAAEWLEQLGADLNFDVLQNTALGNAARSENAELVRHLAPRCNAQSINRALQAAAAADRAAMIALLCELGGARVDHAYREGFAEPALFVAAHEGFVECVRALLDHGADANLDASELAPASPLLAAISAGQLPVIELLLARGADPLRVYKGALGDKTSALELAQQIGTESLVARLRAARVSR